MILYIIAAILVLLIIIFYIRINVIFTLTFEDGINGLELYIKYAFLRLKIFPPAPKANPEEKAEETETPDSEPPEQLFLHEAVSVKDIIKKRKNTSEQEKEPLKKKPKKEKHKKAFSEHPPDSEESPDNKLASLKMIYTLIQELKSDVGRILKFALFRLITIRDFRLETRIGLDDPMTTGMAVGAADAFIYNFLGSLDRKKILKSFYVDISPEWDKKIIKGGLYIRIYTNILTALRLGLMCVRPAVKAWIIIKKK